MFNFGFFCGNVNMIKLLNQNPDTSSSTRPFLDTSPRRAKILRVRQCAKHHGDEAGPRALLPSRKLLLPYVI